MKDLSKPLFKLTKKIDSHLKELDMKSQNLRLFSVNYYRKGDYLNSKYYNINLKTLLILTPVTVILTVGTKNLIDRLIKKRKDQ